jgi:hypothetical protein
MEGLMSVGAREVDVVVLVWYDWAVPGRAVVK